MRILVTGGAGFIGSHLVDKLIEQGHKVVVVDNLSTGKKENLNPEAKFYNIDIRASELSHVFQEEMPEIVFHLAAQINLRRSVEDPYEDCTINILGSLSLFENSKKTGVKRIIFTSTGGAIYGDSEIVPTPEDYNAQPSSPYGVAKLSIERYLDYYSKVFGLRHTVLRLANVYGPRQNPHGEAGVVAIFCDRFLNNQRPIINGDGTQTRDYVFVDDAVKSHLLALEKDKSGTFNVGRAEEISVNEIYNTLKEIGSFGLEAENRPAKAGEQKRSCLDYSKIKQEMGWEPRHDLKQGIERTIEWHRSRFF